MGVLEGFFMRLKRNDPMMIELQKSIVWKIIKEKKIKPFGKDAKVRVVCGFRLEKFWYGENWKGKSRKEKTGYIFNTRLCSALKNFASQQGCTMNNFPDRVFDSKGNEFYIGTCAEDDAATQLLNFYEKNENKKIDIKKIAFSSALNPKTMKEKKYCITCKTVFDL